MTSLNSSHTNKILDALLVAPVTVDIECTTKAKGNPFNQLNKLVTIQVKKSDSPPIIFTKENFNESINSLSSASVVIGFNLKFDLHWLRRELGYEAKCVWDCQLAEFILSGQTWKYPDLNTTLLNYGFEPKIDKVKEYWDQGYDTDEIPIEILHEYGAYDVEGTYNVFLKQVQRFKEGDPRLFKLFRLHCNDLLVLEEMEFNGIVYDEEASLKASQDYQAQLNHLEAKIHAFVPNVPCFNIDSRDHVSCLLYGGTITDEVRVPIGVYKTGQKVGQPRYKIMKPTYDLPRIVEPLKNSELKKEGYFSTEESTLLSLKPNKSVKSLITWLLERVKIVKLKSTYLEGLPKTIKDHGWLPNMLHSTLNQCVATTGRLSSVRPNQQNFLKEAKKFCITRYKS